MGLHAVTGVAKPAASVFAELSASGEPAPAASGIAELSPLLRSNYALVRVENDCECSPKQRAIAFCALSFIPCVGWSHFYLNRDAPDQLLRRLANVSCGIATGVLIVLIVMVLGFNINKQKNT